MKKLFDDEDDELELHQEEKAKILVTVIPFVLIIIILAITLLISSLKNRELERDNNRLQESIKEYADENLENGRDGNVEGVDVLSQEIATAAPSAEPTSAPTATPSAKPTATPEPEIEIDYSKVEYNKDSQLKEMMSYWADNHQKALNDLVNLDHYKAMSWSLKGTKNFYYYGDLNANGQPHGKGIAVYGDNQYYYGDWANGVRSGKGTWMHYHFHAKPSKTDLYTYHHYTGSWKNDLPDGEGSEHYDLNMDILEENKRYVTNLIGSYRGGLVHGEFYLTTIYSDENMKEWYATGENGSWVYKSDKADKEGRKPVYVETNDKNNYIWMHPVENKNIGVPCLISKNKN